MMHMAYSTDDLARVSCTFPATLVSIRSTSPHSLSYIYIYQSLVTYFNIFYLIQNPTNRPFYLSPLNCFLYILRHFIPLFLSFYYFAFLNPHIHRFLATINRQINKQYNHVSDTWVEKRCCYIIARKHLDLFNSYENH